MTHPRRKLDEMKLAGPVKVALAAAGLHRLEHLAGKSIKQLAAIKGVTKAAAETLHDEARHMNMDH